MLSKLHRRIVSLSLVLGISALLVGTGTLTANAHDQLVSTDPKAGSTQTTAPHKLKLEFNEAVLKIGAKVRVTSGGKHFETGSPKISDGTVTQKLKALPNGKYKVSWRVVSSDGHPVGNTFSFRVKHKTQDASAKPSATAKEAVVAAPSASAAAQKASQESSSPAWMPWVTIGAVIVGAGLMAYMYARSKMARNTGSTSSEDTSEDK